MTIGRIYKIVSGQTSECYVGSTFSELRYRFRQHKDNYKSWKNGKPNGCTSFDLFDKYGLDNCHMILIKEYEIEDRKHLQMYEQLWINRLKSINKQSAFVIEPVLKKKIAEQQKKYYEENKEERVEYQKKYYEENKEEIVEYQKKYREENKEEIAEYKKKWYEENKEEISEKRKEKITCEICNCEIIKHGKSRHEKSKKHLNNSLQ